MTCRNKKEASKISGALLDKRLISCASSISGVGSRFWWAGKIDSAREVMVIVKSSVKNFRKIEKEIKKLHSYEVPEIIAVPIIAGSADYLRWIGKSVKTANVK